jgi:hypothetical protein
MSAYATEHKIEIDPRRFKAKLQRLATILEDDPLRLRDLMKNTNTFYKLAAQTLQDQIIHRLLEGVTFIPAITAEYEVLFHKVWDETLPLNATVIETTQKETFLKEITA